MGMFASSLTKMSKLMREKNITHATLLLNALSHGFILCHRINLFHHLVVVVVVIVIVVVIAIAVALVITIGSVFFCVSVVFTIVSFLLSFGGDLLFGCILRSRIDALAFRIARV